MTVRYRLAEKKLSRRSFEVLLAAVLFEHKALLLAAHFRLLLRELLHQEVQLRRIALHVRVHALIGRLPREHCAQRKSNHITSVQKKSHHYHF